MAEELPKEETKEINGVTLTNLEISKIAMICDYLVLDRFNDISSFFRFEKCFGPLLSKEDPKLLIEAFQEICGPKRKYITFGRLISAYIKWKTNSSQNESFNKFMKIVFNDMIKTENEVIGKLEEGTRIFSTKNTRGRKIISKFGVFSDSSKNCIQGFNIQYDDFFDSLLCVKKKPDQDKDITLEMNFHPNGKTVLDRDGISHIAGKFSVKTKIIKFLIFKCRSGKTFCIGDNTEENDEQIELFIFGTSSCQLKTLRIETIDDRLAYLEPKFQPSMRVNQKIIPFEEIDEKFINANIINSQLIYEENEIQNVPLENLDEKTLLIPCIDDDAFINDKESLKEPLFGKDFNEVYNFYLQREKGGAQKEDTELKKNMLAQTVRRVGLLKYYAKKYKVKENIDVLKHENKEEEERINMDKHLAKIKRFKRKINKKKEDLKVSLKRENMDDYEQDEDWPEEAKKEEAKIEEIKEEGKIEEIKEEGKAEEIKEEEKIEEIKEEGKIEEIKEEGKVEEIKEEEKKDEGEKIEIKIDVPVEKEEEKIEIKIEEDKKDEEIKIQDSENIKIDSNNVEEVKLEEDNEGKENKIRLRGNRPKKLLNKSKIKKEEKEEEIKEAQEEKKVVVEEIIAAPEEKKIVIEEIIAPPEDKKENVEEKKVAQEDKKEIIEEIKEAPKEKEVIEEIKAAPEEKKENEEEKKVVIENKKEEAEEIKEAVENKNENAEGKNQIKEEKKENPEEKKEEEKKIVEDKTDKNETTKNKKEDDLNLNNYEDNKLKDDNKDEIKEVKNDDEQNNKSKCANCVLF